MLEILESDRQHARWYAGQVIPYAYDRMADGNVRRRWEHLYTGKIAEMVIERHLSENHGMEILPEVIGRADVADGRFVVGGNHELLVDIKTFDIYRTYGSEIRTSETVLEQSWALVPVDQLNRHKDIYVFGFLLGNFVDFADGFVDVEENAGVCGLVWASRGQVVNWQLFRRGERLFPYFMTRVTNRGCLVRDLPKLEDLARALEQMRPG